jgi:hypothetical protein
MVPENSLPCSQKSVTFPYFEIDGSIPRQSIIFLYDTLQYHPPMRLGLPIDYSSSLTKNMNVFLIFSKCVKINSLVRNTLQMTFLLFRSYIQICARRCCLGTNYWSSAEESTKTKRAMKCSADVDTSRDFNGGIHHCFAPYTWRKLH